MEFLKLWNILESASRITNRLNKNLKPSEGEVIVSVPIKIIVGKDGKVKQEEYVSFMDEYNKIVNEVEYENSKL